MTRSAGSFSKFFGSRLLGERRTARRVGRVRPQKFFPQVETLEVRVVPTASLDFDIPAANQQNPGAVVSYAGGSSDPLIGNNINVDFVFNTATFATLFISSSTLTFTTGPLSSFSTGGNDVGGNGEWDFGNSSSAITITGITSATGASPATLLTGSFTGITTVDNTPGGTQQLVGTAVLTAVNSAVASALGTTAGVPYSGAFSLILNQSSITPPDAFTDSSISSGSVSVSPLNTPNINTSQTPAIAFVGEAISDTATVTGLVSPSSSDTVTFNLYSSATVQNSSTLLHTDTETVTISGSTATATSSGYTPTGVGSEFWVATFNGDTNNAKVTSGSAAEQVNVDTINTSQQPASATAGSSIADMAAVTGLVSPSSGDTVTFNLYSSATVQNGSTLLFSNTQPLTISGSTGTATSAGYIAAAPGTDYWVATFNGDSNNAKVSSSPTAEPVTITGGTPQLTITKVPTTRA